MLAQYTFVVNTLTKSVQTDKKLMSIILKFYTLNSTIQFPNPNFMDRAVSVFIESINSTGK